ncbi:MAG: SPOR domain-containing protein [Bacteroidales bacterium]|nr:SPOR domain-containing protein [Bacteroidales bacterium]
MRRFVTIGITVLATATAANAQTFMDQLRQTAPGKGTVTVTQSKAIDDLINGSNKEAVTAGTNTKTDGAKAPTTATHAKTDKPKATETAKKNSPAKTEAVKTNENEYTEEIPTVDMRKKVMRNSYKVDGYRVQAFAGGNTRADRQQAERIRNEIKMKFPGQPVYVHFYSPRWICRVGNYRNYEEADWMLQQLRKMGYKSATIVKGKITVQY